MHVMKAQTPIKIYYYTWSDSCTKLLLLIKHFKRDFDYFLRNIENGEQAAAFSAAISGAMRASAAFFLILFPLLLWFASTMFISSYTGSVWKCSDKRSSHCVQLYFMGSIFLLHLTPSAWNCIQEGEGMIKVL